MVLEGAPHLASFVARLLDVLASRAHQLHVGPRLRPCSAPLCTLGRDVHEQLKLASQAHPPPSAQELEQGHPPPKPHPSPKPFDSNPLPEPLTLWTRAPPGGCWIVPLAQAAKSGLRIESEVILRPNPEPRPRPYVQP